MLVAIKGIDKFSKNIIIVFLGTSFVNMGNLLYQFLIAHQLEHQDFATFNSLLCLFVLISAPISTLQTVVAKYTAEFYAQGQEGKIKSLLSGLLKKVLFFSALTFLLFCVFSPSLLDRLKITSGFSGYIIAAALALVWIVPVLTGALQGLELFKWLASVSILGATLKLILAFLFIWLGFSIAGALGALLLSTALGVSLSLFALRRFLTFKAIEGELCMGEILRYILPVSITYLCFMSLVSMDMVMVKYFFSPFDAGLYALAQMIGKIILFLPGAISVALFPRSSGLNAQQLNAVPLLRRSLCYAAVLCLLMSLLYNILPALVLRMLTGKAFAVSILLGRFFCLSMASFALLFIMITYFLSIRDLRFIKYLAAFTLLQALAIVGFHKSLLWVQWILCVNAFLLFILHLALARSRR